MTRRAWIAPAAAGLLGACSLAPAHVRPALPVPASWPVGDSYLQRLDAPVPTLSSGEVFRDPRLQALIAQALANNRDLRVAAANVAAARARARVARAQRLPEVVIGASGDVRRANGTTADSGGLDVGVSAFELDLFGRLANAAAAERERALSTEAAARTVRLAVVTDLADAWATYAADRVLLDIARDTAASARRSVALTRARLEGGIAPRTDLRQAEQVLFTAEADIAQGTAALALDANLIQLLVGAPIDLALLPRDLAEADAAITPVAAGASAETLLRRPEVIEAEYLLRAADA
ncbi:MAG: TolC family protein, partial [Novosphingobium sp.]